MDRIGTHTLRKTFGYHYYRKTKDISTLMEFFNHSCKNVTRKYIGIFEEEQSNTAKLKKNYFLIMTEDFSIIRVI